MPQWPTPGSVLACGDGVIGVIGIHECWEPTDAWAAEVLLIGERPLLLPTWNASRRSTRSVRRCMAGDTVALLGANGCGKSTLLKVLDGLAVSLIAGRYSCARRSLSPRTCSRTSSSRSASAAAIGFIFQNSDAQVFSPSVREEIAFGPLQMGIGRDEVEQRIADVMAMLEIADLADRAPYQLSGGEKKRVAIASVLVMNPEVLLFDEPTAALDPRTQQWLVELIVELNRAGKTIVLATHDLDVLDDLADRCVVLSEDHRVAADGPTAPILADEELLRRGEPRAPARALEDVERDHCRVDARPVAPTGPTRDDGAPARGFHAHRRDGPCHGRGPAATKIQQQHPEVHLSTVYRTLDSLEKLGIVEHTHVGHGPAVYHVGVTHQHLVCEECGAGSTCVPTHVLEGVGESPLSGITLVAHRALRIARPLLSHTANARHSQLVINTSNGHFQTNPLRRLTTRETLWNRRVEGSF